jgi:hypothetical protein
VADPCPYANISAFSSIEGKQACHKMSTISTHYSGLLLAKTILVFTRSV